MILEVAILNVKSGETAAFEAAFAQAQRIVSGTAGCVSHELQICHSEWSGAK
ncbi:antibiotic biosynthesis monooxygenase [Candidatus Leptofilum sp.]|uniref:antibiotic biosynthesis monooxygenase n=1 Tax=Candidatus Leptofilum sp. TaxID=3241576 RepID=UPI003B59CFD8